MSVPFVRIYPHGKGTIQHVSRPLMIEQRSLEFLTAGGWYTIEIRPTGKVKLAATDANLNEFCACEAWNDPNLEDAVDDLVMMSQDYIGLCREQALKH